MRSLLCSVFCWCVSAFFLVFFFFGFLFLVCVGAVVCWSCLLFLGVWFFGFLSSF